MPRFCGIRLLCCGGNDVLHQLFLYGQAVQEHHPYLDTVSEGLFSPKFFHVGHHILRQKTFMLG